MFISVLYFVHVHTAATANVASPARSAAVLFDQRLGETFQHRVIQAEVEIFHTSEFFVLLADKPLASSEFATGVELHVIFAS